MGRRNRDRERLGYDESKGAGGWIFGGFMIFVVAAAVFAVLVVLDHMKG